MTRTHTHTVAELALSGAAYDEIRKSLEAAGYQHAFDADGMIDMTGIGVTRDEAPPIPVPMTIEHMERDFIHHHRTELFDGPEAYFTWLQEQKRLATEPTR